MSSATCGCASAVTARSTLQASAGLTSAAPPTRPRVRTDVEDAGRYGVNAADVEVHASKGEMYLHAKHALTASSDDEITLHGETNAFLISRQIQLAAGTLARIGGPRIELHATASIRLVVGGSSIEITSDGIKITSTGEVQVNDSSNSNSRRNER